MKNTLCIILTVALLTSCASVGTPVATENVSKIKRGVTTERELVAWFGEPSTRSTGSDGKTILIWMHTTAHAKGTSFIPIAGAFVGGAKAETQMLTISMRANGTVDNYRMTNSQADSSMHGD